nr:hypothetical protein TorRG33x02_100610 [Ipomoea batatas]
MVPVIFAVTTLVSNVTSSPLFCTVKSYLLDPPVARVLRTPLLDLNIPRLWYTGTPWYNRSDIFPSLLRFLYFGMKPWITCESHLAALKRGDIDITGGSGSVAGGLEHGGGEGGAVVEVVELLGAEVIGEDVEGEDVFDGVERVVIFEDPCAVEKSKMAYTYSDKIDGAAAESCISPARKRTKVNLEGLDVLLEAERSHRPEKIVAVDRFPLLSLALVGRLAGDEADELRHALLHRLLGVLRDLRVRRQRLLHDPAHVGYRQEPVLLPRRISARAAVVTARIVVGIRHPKLLQQLGGKTAGILYLFR